jgi:hypothetical protein
MRLMILLTSKMLLFVVVSSRPLGWAGLVQSFMLKCGLLPSTSHQQALYIWPDAPIVRSTQFDNILVLPQLIIIPTREILCLYA